MHALMDFSDGAVAGSYQQPEGMSKVPYIDRQAPRAGGKN